MKGIQVASDQIDEKIAQFSISRFLVNTVEDIQMTEQFHKVTKVYTLCSGLNAMYMCANALHVLPWRDESEMNLCLHNDLCQQ